MSDRRHFLRALCALPMIGGGVTLIGRPTAVARPVTRELLAGYDCWLDMERRYLAYERANGDHALWKKYMSSICMRHPAGQFDHFNPTPPSSRAALVLSAVGIEIDPRRT